MSLPKDPMMLCSVVNMKLRDREISLDELCREENIDRQDLESTLKNVGFEFDEDGNRFW